jgi:hypothetical protein
MVPCEIWTGLTRSEEAAIFALLNNTRKPTPLTNYRIQLTAQNRRFKAIDGVVASNGFVVKTNRGPAKLGVNPIKAVAVLEWIEDFYNLDRLDDTLRVIYSAFSDAGIVDRAATKDQFIKAIAVYLAEHEEESPDHLIEKLKGRSAEDLYERAEEMTADNRRALSGNIAKLIKELPKYRKAS